MCKSNNIKLLKLLKLLKIAVKLIKNRSFELPTNDGWVPIMNKEEIEFIEDVKKIEEQNGTN